ncbi:MAG: single-stranded-DNA-specific exonuclease RecJ [Chromatiales bacterium]|nr:single-stranded-DNA-specific exonuclease RecJ [Chromatiales bacterium]
MRLIRRRVAPVKLLQSFPADMHPVLQRVYAARNTAADQLVPSLAQMIPVGALAGATAAAMRLADARVRQERVLILGDFDTDGATATALCISCLRAMGFADVVYLVPNRIEFGYGLSPAIVDEAAKLRPDLIVTVDNGISSIDGVERAKQQGIDVIVTDHHLPGLKLPDAVAIVNPNLADEPFPSKCLSGVGVAFYVLAALGRLLADRGLIGRGQSRSIVADGLDLVALGTVADLVRLDYNNRIHVTEGLARMRSGRTRPGIRALFTVAGRNIRDARANDLGYAIAPRLNAAGRLTDMSLGIDCLLAQSDAEALQLAKRLDALNIERRQLQAQMEAKARDFVASATRNLVDSGEDDRHDAYCLFDANWHEGVVGLVASRIKDQVHRPVVAFAPADQGGLLKGSARSIEGIHIRDVIDAIAARHPDLVNKFGGYAMAAGMTIDGERLDTFRQAFVAEVRQHTDALTGPDLIWTDGELAAAELNLDLAEELRRGGPWGQGFPEPLFENVLEVVDHRVLKDAHLKLRVSHPDGKGLTEAIIFNQTQFPDGFDGSLLKLVYRLDVNEYRNRRTAQLVVEHMQSA